MEMEASDEPEERPVEIVEIVQLHEVLAPECQVFTKPHQEPSQTQPRVDQNERFVVPRAPDAKRRRLPQLSPYLVLHEVSTDCYYKNDH